MPRAYAEDIAWRVVWYACWAFDPADASAAISTRSTIPERWTHLDAKTLCDDDDFAAALAMCHGAVRDLPSSIDTALKTRGSTSDRWSRSLCRCPSVSHPLVGSDGQLLNTLAGVSTSPSRSSCTEGGCAHCPPQPACYCPLSLACSSMLAPDTAHSISPPLEQAHRCRTSCFMSCASHR